VVASRIGSAVFKANLLENPAPRSTKRLGRTVANGRRLESAYYQPGGGIKKTESVKEGVDHK